jgi:biopolymer transport protein ExbD
MTPMVDVAFLLLIFFMCTTQFKPPEEVPVHLPGSSSEIAAPARGVILVSVDREGRIYIEDSAGQTAEVTREALSSKVLSERAKRPQAPLVVKGDKDAEFGAIAHVMRTLQETKTNRFNLMTEYKVSG